MDLHKVTEDNVDTGKQESWQKNQDAELSNEPPLSLPETNWLLHSHKTGTREF